MAQLVISYAREQQLHAKRIVNAARKRGIDVWWDDDLEGGTDFRAQIAAQIEKADCVLVLWCDKSVKAGYVVDEATLALRHSQYLPVRRADVHPPLGFMSYHCMDLFGAAISTKIERLLDEICAKVNQGADLAH